MRKVLLFIFFGIFSAAITAAQPSAIDFTQPLLGPDGRALRMDAAKDAAVLTLSDVAVTALDGQVQTDQQESGADKYKRGLLAQRIYQNRSAILTVEEIALIKERIGKTYGPAVVVSAWNILDPASAKGYR